MNYLTNYYKNLSEQLQEKVNYLQKLIEDAASREEAEKIFAANKNRRAGEIGAVRTQDELETAGSYDTWGPQNREYSTLKDKLASDLAKVGYSRAIAAEMGDEGKTAEGQRKYRGNIPPIGGPQAADYASKAQDAKLGLYRITDAIGRYNKTADEARKGSKEAQNRLGDEEIEIGRAFENEPRAAQMYSRYY